MKVEVFSIYDSAAEAYNQPFFAQAKGQAVRMFTQMCNDPKSNINQYPSDFTLFHIGSFDDSSAKFTLHPSPIGLGVAVEYKNKISESVDTDVSPTKIELQG